MLHLSSCVKKFPLLSKGCSQNFPKKYDRACQHCDDIPSKNERIVCCKYITGPD